MNPAQQIRLRRLVAVALVGAAVVTPLTQLTAAQARSLCAPPADTVPPQVTSLTLSKQSVDLNSGSRRVGITADVTDTSANGTPSGVAGVQVEIDGNRGGAEVRLALTGGTAADGVWTGHFTVPVTAMPGTWSVRFVFAADAKGNEQMYQQYGARPQSPTDIRLQTGWDTTLAVTGTTQKPPPPASVTPGHITGFTITPDSVNAAATAKTVHFTATFSAPYPQRVYGYLQARNFFRRVTFNRGPGGVWHGHLKVTRWMGKIKMLPDLDAVYPSGDQPRVRNLNRYQLQLHHFSYALSITSGVDKTKPVLTSLAFAPSSVDTTSGTQTVAVTATAKDTESGVQSIDINEGVSDATAAEAAPVGGFYPYPGIGYSVRDDVGAPLKRQGNEWVGTLTFGKCVPAGTWRANVTLRDRAGNDTGESSKKLAAQGLPATISVTSTPGDVEDPYVRDATASGQTNTITLDFSEGVKNVTTSTLSVYALKPASHRFEQTTPVSGMVCSNGTSTVDCSGSGGLVTSAVLTVPAVVSNAAFDVYANQGEITPQLTDGVGNPLDWSYPVAQQVTGS